MSLQLRLPCHLCPWSKRRHGFREESERRSAIRERIIANLIDLFSRQGIAVVTMDQIAEAADIGTKWARSLRQRVKTLLITRCEFVVRQPSSTAELGSC
jgi:hypothetical protein